LVVFGGGYLYREHQKAEALKSEIVGMFQRLGPISGRYRDFRGKIEGRVMEVADQDPPERHVDPRLRISSLHKARGVYLRLGARQARTREGIAAAALDLRADGIGRCLGVAPTSLKGLYEQGAFLMPEWLDEVEGTSGVMRLRVLRDDLARRAERDLPNLANVLQAEYFLLAVQQGQSRRDDPVDMYLWDLKRDQLLLSLRTRSTGTLVPIRVALPGTPPVLRQRPLRDTLLADDCSIAAQVKEAAGEPAMTFGSEMPTPSSEARAPVGEGEETGKGATEATPPDSEPAHPDSEP
jgi:hypothetical protein